MPLPRLPDIPVESWVADQTDLFQKQVQNYFPALEFDAAAQEQENQIPADWPYPGGQDQWEEAAQQAAQEEQRRQQQAAIEAEQARQQSLAEQAWNAASGLGIPTPTEIGDYFHGLVGTPPGTGDNSSTTGAFEQGTPFSGNETTPGVAMPQDVGSYPPPQPAAGMIDRRNDIIPSDMPSDVLNSPTTQRYSTAADERGQRLIDTASSLPSAIWGGIKDTAQGAYDSAKDFTAQVPGAVEDYAAQVPDQLAATGRLIAGDNAVNELGAGAQGVGTLGRYSYNAGKAYVEGAAGKAWEKAQEGPPSTPEEMIRRGNSMTRGLQDTQDILAAGGDKAARQVALDYGFTDAPVTQNPLTGEPVSALDIAGIVGQIALDPTNLIGGGEGAKLAHTAEESLPFAARLAAEQARLGAADDVLGIGSKVGNAPSAVYSVAGKAAEAGKGLVSDLLTSAPARSLDETLGRGATALGQGARRIAQNIAEHPDEATTLAGGALADLTGPEGETPEERLQRVGIGAAVGPLAIRAKKLPFAEEGAAGFRRLYHGTGSGWDLVNSAAFDPNGLFGPAHYLTSDPRIAATYADARQEPSAIALQAIEPRRQDALEQLQNLADVPENAGKRRALEQHLEWLDTLETKRVKEAPATGMNIRPADLDDRATLFHADENVPSSDLKRIGNAAMRLFGDDPELGMAAQEYHTLSRSGQQIDGESLYNALAQDFGASLENMDADGNLIGDKKIANDILSEAGFDGVYYKGGQRIGALDDKGFPIEHDAVAIFPDKLDAVRNAFTGERGGAFLPPGLAFPAAKATAGAAAGAETADQTGDQNAPPDYTRLATGAGLGALAALGVSRIPARGTWKTRLEEGLKIPEGASEAEAAKIEQMFNKAVSAFGQSQGEKRATRRMRFGSDAEAAWKDYEDLRAGVKGEPNVVEPVRPRPVEEPAPIQEAKVEEAPVLDTEAGTLPPAEPGDVLFEPEPLPDSIDPKRVFDPEEAQKLTTQLHDTLAASPADQAWANKQAMEMLKAPKITGKFVNQLLTGVGLKRATGRYGPKEEEAATFANKFLQDNGWIAKPGEGSTTALSTIAPVNTPATDTLGRATNVLARGTQMGVQGGVGAAVNAQLNPDDPYAAEKGFVAGALVPSVAKTIVRHGAELTGKEVPEAEGALSTLGSVFGHTPGKLAKELDADPIISAGTQMFRAPQRQQNNNVRRLSEIVHDHWRNSIIAHGTDILAGLQGMQNDIARVFRDQTGHALPAEVMVAESKRFNSNKAMDMEVQDHFQPALKTFARLDVPNHVVDRYLLNLQNLDIAQAQSSIQHISPNSPGLMLPNYTRKFPGGQTATDAAIQNQHIEAKLQARLSPAQYQEFQDAISMVHDFGDRVLKYSLEGKLIDQATYDTLRQKYPHYVPTRILDYINDDRAYAASGKSLSVNSNLLHELSHQGTDREAMSPMAALLGQAYQVHAAAQKNNIANQLVDLWRLASGRDAQPGFLPPIKDPNIWSQVSGGLPQPAWESLSNRERRIANFGEGIQLWPTATGKVPDQYQPFTLFRNGQKIKLAVDKDLGALTKFPSPTTIPVLSGLMSAFRAGATARNPLFLSANMLLDLANVGVRETAREARNPVDLLNPISGAFPRVMDEWMKSMGEYVASPQAWKDMLTGEFRGDMAEALRHGGGMSGGHYGAGALRAPDWGTLHIPGIGDIDPNPLRRKLGITQESELEQRVKDLQKGMISVHSPADVAKAIKDIALFKPVETIGERIELAGRVPAYRLSMKRTDRAVLQLNDEMTQANKAIAAGKTPKRSPAEIQRLIDEQEAGRYTNAVQNFRTTTLDFDKGGDWAKAINQIIPFFNVGVQSVADIGRSVQQNPKAFPAAVAAGVVVPTAIAEAWNQADPQRAKDYADVPSYLKDQGLVFMLPETVGDGIPDSAKAGVPQHILDQPLWPAFQDKQGNRTPQFFHFRYRQLAPIAAATRAALQSTLYKDNLETQDRRSLLDQAISQVGQLSPLSATNPQDFYSSIMPPVASTMMQLSNDRDTFHGNRRIATQYGDERASPLSHAISDVLEPIGAPYSRPSQIEFATRDIGSGVAAAYHGASEIPEQMRGELPLTPQNQPIIGGLRGRWVKNTIGGEAQDAEANTITPSADAALRAYKIRWRPEPESPAIKNIPLLRGEYAAYQNDINQATDIAIQEMIRDPDWQTLPTADKEMWLKKNVDLYRRMVTRQHFAALPDDAEERLQREIDAGHLTTTGRKP
jgi:hypothetical protein